MAKMKAWISRLLAFVLVLGLIPSAGAEETPRVVCNEVQATPGDWITLTVKAEAFENLASLELEIYYDSDDLSIQDCTLAGFLDSAVTSVNTDTPGCVILNTAAAAGLSGDGTLLRLSFRVSDDCDPGKYPVTVAVGEAYDTGLNPVTVGAVSGSVTVTARTAVQLGFSLGLRADRTLLHRGERITLTLSNQWCQPVAGCELTLDYDSSLFRLVEVTLPEEMTQNGAVYSINDSLAGSVRLTYAAVSNSYSSEMMTVILEATENVNAETRFTACADDLYAADLTPYQSDSTELTAQVQAMEEVTLPRLYLESETMVIGERCTAVLKLEAGSGVAAADFTLTYDPELLACTTVEAADLADGQVVINPNYQNGTIRFSFVDEDGAQEETALIRITWTPAEGADRHYAVSSSGYKVVDSDFEAVALDYAENTGCIHTLETLEATCDEPGGTAYVCVSCGSRVYLDETPALGHLYGAPEFSWAADYTSCTARRDCARDPGHTETVACAVSRTTQGGSCYEPGSVTYTAAAIFDGAEYTDTVTVELDVLGHDYAWVVDSEPTCTEKGSRHGTCTRCGHTAEESIPALGHDWEGMRCRRCGAVKENPFTDVPEGSFYYDPVMWAVENGITNGTTPTTFGPNDQCMRAHVVTFLWRAAGSPEPASTANPFVDVKPADFYYKAVLWAVEQGITNGLDATHFGPFAYCNRAQVVTFLHRAMGNPTPQTTDNPFTDVQPGAFYYSPVLWAVENGITNGLSATAFGPTAICNRAQIVTFLYRAFHA